MMNEEQKEDMPYLTMWTVQTQPMLEALNCKGISHVKKQYITEKYGETAWIFQEAYRFFIDKAKKVVEQPLEAESPVWMFADKRWAVPPHDSYLLKLRVPINEIVLFDLRLWSKVLNLTYIGSEIQELEFERKLTKNGVSHSTDVFSQPYYPQLKHEIIKSWDRLFDAEGKETEYMQGATWYIKKEWIIE